MEMINIFVPMIEANLYDPFKSFDLVGAKCFLTGVPVSKGIDTLSVFPEWLMQAEDLYDKPFKLLDESYCTYKDLKLGISADANNAILVLQTKAKIAFETGDANLLSDVEWFQWSGILVYGLVSAEIKNGLKSEEYKEEGFKISPVLINKFRTLHKLLQSIVLNFEWENPKPFSLFVYNLQEEQGIDKFQHRNEINTLTFSFRYNNLGIIICLLDEEYNKNYHQPLLANITSNTLSLLQFEELAARVYYSNYLFSLLPEFSFTEHKGTVYVTNKDLALGARKVFENWEEKTYAQVLEAFWKPWNYSRVEILKNPEKAMSFLIY
jgi:hypothetical protein